MGVNLRTIGSPFRPSVSTSLKRSGRHRSVRAFSFGVLATLVGAELLGEPGDRDDRGRGLPGEMRRVARQLRAASVERYAATLVEVAIARAELGLAVESAATLETARQLYRAEPVISPSISGEERPRDGTARDERPEAALPKALAARARRARAALERAASLVDDSGSRRQAAARLTDRERLARRTFVSELSRLANRCVDDGYPALGYDVVLWALQHAPDDPRLRKALRERRWTDERTGVTRWYAPLDLAQAKAGKIDDARYGWVTADELRRLRAGQVLVGSEWIPKRRASPLRRHWSGRWTHETEHFVIHTNASRERAVAFGRVVESFYAFVFRALVDFFEPDDRTAALRLVVRHGRELDHRKLRLHYHRSRASYLWEIDHDPVLRSADRALTRESGGFYWGQNGRAYFYSGARGPDVATVYHEVTHQILGEAVPAGARPPAWLVEGIAVFMESTVILGEPGAERLVVGREPPAGVRASQHASRGEVADINSFIHRLGTSEPFHAGPRRHEHYATAGAIVHFFLLHDGGVLRRAFIRYAREAYRNDRPEVPTPIDALYNYLDLTQDELQMEWQSFHANPDVFDF